MTKEKNKKTNPILDFEGTEIDLTKFNLQSDKEQYDEVKKVLQDIYKDNLDINKKIVMKVIRITLNAKDDYVYLPNNLKVSKEKLKLKFEVVPKKQVGLGIILAALWVLIFTIVGATYSGVYYFSIKDLNKDIDGDGIADINIDITGDNKANINVDTTGDNKPNLNIDYKGNRKSIFNIDYDGDGIPDFNLVNDTSAEGAVCTINCDTDGDGWPDLNLDLDGDGTPDVNIITGNDNLPNLNLDMDGDGVCDLLCDTDSDGIADTNIIETPITETGTGSSSTTGSPDVDQESASLILKFEDGYTLSLDGIVPDDQPNYDASIKPYKQFTVENLSNFDLEYSILMIVNYNTFVGSNFKYKLDGTNGVEGFGYKVAPYTDTYIVKNQKIAKKTLQSYTVTFNLEGINAPQNYDQGKKFSATFKIEV